MDKGLVLQALNLVRADEQFSVGFLPTKFCISDPCLL